MGAMAWIRESTPPDAKFLANAFLTYGGTAVVGADAGWWIPLLTGRENTVPPMNYGMEAPHEPRYWNRVDTMFRSLERFPPETEAGVRYLRDSGITHVYIGRAGGRVGNPGEPLIDVDALSNSPAYHLVYHRDGVWIFSLDTQGS
jgi:hypothetical protein